MLGKNLFEDVDASLNVLRLPCRVQEQGNGNGTKALCFRAKDVLIVNLFRIRVLFGLEREFSGAEADVLGSLAGTDTILVIAQTAEDGERLEALINKLSNSRK